MAKRKPQLPVAKAKDSIHVVNLASYTSAGLWTHITCTYGAGVKYIYINIKT